MIDKKLIDKLGENLSNDSDWNGTISIVQFYDDDLNGVYIALVLGDAKKSTQHWRKPVIRYNWFFPTNTMTKEVYNQTRDKFRDDMIPLKDKPNPVFKKNLETVLRMFINEKSQVLNTEIDALNKLLKEI